MYLPPLTPAWRPRAVRCSARTHKGLPEIWSAMVDFQTAMTEHNLFQSKRAEQSLKAMWRQISDSLLDRLKESAGVREEVNRLESMVGRGEITAGRAADEVLARFLEGGGR